MSNGNILSREVSEDIKRIDGMLPPKDECKPVMDVIKQALVRSLRMSEAASHYSRTNRYLLVAILVATVPEGVLKLAALVSKLAGIL